MSKGKSIDVVVRETETSELMEEYKELTKRLDWIEDELWFRFDHERKLGDVELHEVAKLLNEHESR